MALRRISACIVAFSLSLAMYAAALDDDMIARYPHVTISNGMVEAVVFVPDEKNGFYRSSRYDWSGVVGQITYNGHTYFTKRASQMPHDPGNPGHGIGLVEEFDSANRVHIPERFDAAKPGETFMKIGVGNLVKPDDGKPYHFAVPYVIADRGKWKVKSGKNWIEFTHELTDAYGYGYRYVKRLELRKGKPELVMSHSLKNTGKKPFSTDQYCHNFFSIDRRETGPDTTVELFFPARFKTDQAPVSVIRGRRITFERKVERGFMSYMEGYSDSTAHNRAVIRHAATRAGVDIGGDFSLFGFNFYADPYSCCPEFFVYRTIDPSKTTKWKRTYVFFTE